MVGLGEAGYGSVGAALIASHFPARMRGALMAGFFASASVGSVLGVMLGGVIAARWGWQAAFGVVGVPGLLLALLYLKVRDYRTVDARRRRWTRKRRSLGEAARHIVTAAGPLAHHAVGLHRRRGAADRRVGAVVVAAELPQPRARHRAGAGRRARRRWSCCAAPLGSVVWGAVVDRAGARRPRRKLVAMALLCIASLVVLAVAFGAGARHRARRRRSSR